MNDDYNQWSTIRPYKSETAVSAMTWVPEEERDRLIAYQKYDEMYWNDPRQFALRFLDGESPLYIPNPRSVVNTTAHYLLKGLEITAEEEVTKKALRDFLKRETFYSRFDAAKLAGVAKGDYVMHMTADPRKPKGSRISLVGVEPDRVFPIWDDDEPGKMVGCHIATTYVLPKSKDPEQKTRLRRLTYKIVEPKPGSSAGRRISREEAIYEIESNSWLGGDEGRVKKIKQLLPWGLLDERITAIPIYWFKNQEWTGEDYGSSELRGIERLSEVVSQGATDVSGSLSLEGLGVYATDGGRPVTEDQQGNLIETEWEVSPGKVMEVPTGAYFRRVQGVGSITPAIDNIAYIEDKINSALGITDVALGKVEATVAQSGIALAIKFLPTLARVEPRDRAGIDKLTQLFYDWKTWYAVFEQTLLTGDIVPTIGDKLPMDRAAKLNELNNMRDRKIIPAQFYRDQMESFGYEFPEDIEEQLRTEAEEAFQDQIQNMMAAQQIAAQQNGQGQEQDPRGGQNSPGPNGSGGAKGNQSNNKNRPNESGGTEAKA